MQAEWLFWAIAAALMAGCLGTVFAPLWRGAGRAERRASYDIQVHRDQLREIEADLARGVLSEAEAAATRIEVSRRLLAAADAEAGEAAAGAAPRRLTRRLAPALLVVAVLGTLGLYGWLGAGGLPDQPLAARLAEAAKARAARPGQAEAEALAARQAPPPQPAAASEDLGLVDQAADRRWRTGPTISRATGCWSAASRRSSAGRRRARPRSGWWRSSATRRPRPTWSISPRSASSPPAAMSRRRPRRRSAGR